jgi:hypothetical protein
MGRRLREQKKPTRYSTGTSKLQMFSTTPPTSRIPAVTTSWPLRLLQMTSDWEVVGVPCRACPRPHKKAGRIGMAVARPVRREQRFQKNRSPDLTLTDVHARCLHLCQVRCDQSQSAHHGRIKGARVQVRELWVQERVRLAAELIEEFGPLPDRPPGDAPIWFVAGLITIADWIGSDERHFSEHVSWDMLERRKRAQTALASIDWRPVRARQLNGFGDLFPEIPQANSLQTASLQCYSGNAYWMNNFPSLLNRLLRVGPQVGINKFAR